MARLRIKNLHRKKVHAAPGAAPGTLVLQPGAKSPVFTVFSYHGDTLEERTVASVAELKPYLDREDAVTWFDVHGLGSEQQLRELAELFKIHPIALEDVVHSPQRPKTERFDQHLFIVARMVMLRSIEDIEAQQLSLFLGRNYLLTLQENSTDCLNPVRERLRRRAGIQQRYGADYLCYSILDAIVDQYFPVLESYGEYLEQLEEQTVTAPTRHTLGQIHTAKRELLDLRRVLFPQRDTINQLIRDESPFICSEVRVFLRDCYDHAVQVMDMVETYREIMSGLHDVYLSSIGNRTNEIMKVLTIISTIFIPLTFIAGVYGMNFENMPELKTRNGYFLTLLAMALIGITLLIYFWRKGWIFPAIDPLAAEYKHRAHHEPPK
jgi:magnesium transporter